MSDAPSLSEVVCLCGHAEDDHYPIVPSAQGWDECWASDDGTWFCACRRWRPAIPDAVKVW